MAESVTADTVLEKLSDVVAELRGYEKTRAALAYSLGAAVAERLEQLDGTPPGYGRLNRRQRIARMRDELSVLVAATKQLDLAEEPVTGPAA